MPQSLTIILPVVALILALVLAAVLWYWWSSGQPETPADEVSEAGGMRSLPQDLLGRLSVVWSAARARIVGMIDARRTMPAGGEATDADLIEILRLYRDLSNGALVVHIGRQKFYTLDEIKDPQVRRRFLGNAEAIAQFARLKKGTSPLIDWSTETADVAPPEPPPVASVARVPAGKPSAPTAESEETDKDTPQPMSMADEIEELLQYQLTLDPELSHRSIHIRSAEDGSIFVDVDGTSFDGVGEVSDPDVRAFLQKIVREWESKK